MSQTNAKQDGMNEEIDAVNIELDLLARTLCDFETNYRRAIGFARTITYEDVNFNVGAHVVVADLAPLAFLHLTEFIDQEGVGAAVAKLHQRLAPLLTCTHHWALAPIGSEEEMQKIIKNELDRGSIVHVCKLCTAYALRREGSPMPTVGRTVT